jgi:hypothetical protein
MKLASLLALLLWFAPVAAFAVPHRIVQENFRWVVPSGNLPEGLQVFHSNNNVAIHEFEGRLYLAFRTAPTHFASAKTLMHILSSSDQGQNWILEKTIQEGSDVREPHFYDMNGSLFFFYCELGKKRLAFTPKKVHKLRRIGASDWKIEDASEFPKEMIWDIKKRFGKLYMTSYHGAHYSFLPKPVYVNFRESTDGEHWTPVNGASSPQVYEGGVSEVAFEFDPAGRMWGVTRLEDGDQTGWGSHVISAEPGHHDKWDVPSYANPNRYDSPKMFSVDGEIYLVARRDLGGPYDRYWRHLPFNMQRWLYLARYSLTRKRTALYHLNRITREFAWVFDLPSAGDTAFPSVIPLNDHRFLVANYTSPLQHKNWIWSTGQSSKKGTALYLIELQFNPGTMKEELPETDPLPDTEMPPGPEPKRD